MNSAPITYDDSLPIAARRAEIAQAIRDHQVIVVCGETGSGKSTQLPKICLELGRGVERLIGHTQPRRIAARSIATRIAEELGCTVGTRVGYKIRFEDMTHPDTRVKVMTDGILLAETQQDRNLEKYDTLIIDEAHERSLNIDFLLGILVRLVSRRADLKLIITSATIDAERFAKHFPGEVPIIKVSGRTYPVEIRYRPLADGSSASMSATDHAAANVVTMMPTTTIPTTTMPTASATSGEIDLPRAIARVLAEVNTLPAGDVLVFLPTERDIHETVQVLRRSDVVTRNTELLPLYARLSSREQQRIFAPHTSRRVVLATNVAESSLTVPGIHYVIDTGLARVSRFVAKSQVQRLPIEPISQASANQRAGRCGRLGPGICWRLYSEEDFLKRDEYATPEIRRTHLAGAILQAKSLRLGPLESLPLIDPPHSDMIRDGYRTLVEIGALDQQRELTVIGRQLARLPIDPRLGRMLIAARENGCLPEMLIVAAALEVQDPRERPYDRREAADLAHRPFHDGRSDFIALLKLWHHFQQRKSAATRGQLRKECERSFLSYNRWRQWQDTVRQLRQLFRDKDPGTQDQLTVDPERYRSDKKFYQAFHQSMLTGLLAGVAWRSDGVEYTGPNQLKLNLWPGCGPFQAKPNWIMAAEFVETNRRYARLVATIEPRWIEQVGRHLLEHSYDQPQWYRRAGTALVQERSTLYGLPVGRRRVPLGPHDPATARDLLIREGLVGGQIDLSDGFHRHNEKLRDDLARQASKGRRTDLLVQLKTCRDFYEARLPPEVVDVATLRRWRRQAEHRQPRLLYMTREDLIGSEPPLLDEQGFPEQFAVRELSLPIRYRFEPGLDEDGVTLTVPRDVLAQLTADRVEWIVPGMLAEKIEALVRSLPKTLRRELPPAADLARRAAAELTYAVGSLLTNVAHWLSRQSSQPIRSTDFQLDKIPYYLFLNLRVVDRDGKVLAQGRDIGRLQKQLGIRPLPYQQWSEPGWTSQGHTKWEWDAVPEEIQVLRGGITIPVFPTLVDRGNSVARVLYDSRDIATLPLPRAIARLYYLDQQKAINEHLDWILTMNSWQQTLADRVPPQQLREQLGLLIASRVLPGDSAPARSREVFQRQLEQGRGLLESSVVAVVPMMTALVAAYAELRHELEHRFSGPKPPDVVTDVRQQISRLLGREFLLETPWSSLLQMPRYLHGARMRLEHYAGHAARDRELAAELARWTSRWDERVAALAAVGRHEPTVNEFRWHLEEYRVSLFAQTLGTAETISSERLQRYWDSLPS